MRIAMATVSLVAAVLTAAALRAPAVVRAQENRGQSTAAAQPAAEVLKAVIDKEGVAAARARMGEMDAHPSSYSFGEKELNALGYAYLSTGGFEQAIAVFEFNIRRFPTSDNVYDSLAEACIIAGDLPRAEATLKAWAAKAAQAGKTSGAIDTFRAQMVRATLCRSKSLYLFCTYIPAFDRF